MIKIDRLADDPNRAPFENLLPIVTFLREHGNESVTGGFTKSRDGWYCRLSQAIDFEAIRAEFDLPETIHLSEDRDTIFDELSWINIVGANWRPTSVHPAS